MAVSASEHRGAERVMQGIDLPAQIFEDPVRFIRAVQAGLSGAIVRQAIAVVGHRAVFVNILGVQSANLSRVYKRKRLNKVDSESVLDLLRVIREAARVFESTDTANEWLGSKVPALGSQRPIDLCDTFEGRELVRAALRKIEYGDFS